MSSIAAAMNSSKGSNALPPGAALIVLIYTGVFAPQLIQERPLNLLSWLDSIVVDQLKPEFLGALLTVYISCAEKLVGTTVFTKVCDRILYLQKNHGLPAFLLFAIAYEKKCKNVLSSLEERYGHLSHHSDFSSASFEEELKSYEAFLRDRLAQEPRRIVELMRDHWGNLGQPSSSLLDISQRESLGTLLTSYILCTEKLVGTTKFTEACDCIPDLQKNCRLPTFLPFAIAYEKNCKNVLSSLKGKYGRLPQRSRFSFAPFEKEHQIYGAFLRDCLTQGTRNIGELMRDLCGNPGEAASPLSLDFRDFFTVSVIPVAA